MKVRLLEETDLDAIREMAADAGYPYPDPESPQNELVVVAVDEQDRPIMVVAAERITQLYLWKDKDLSPIMAFRALRELHEKMPLYMRICGYRETNAFLPPEVAEKFGKRLERSFGWKPNWSSWFRTFWA